MAGTLAGTEALFSAKFFSLQARFPRLVDEASSKDIWQLAQGKAQGWTSSGDMIIRACPVRGELLHSLC